MADDDKPLGERVSGRGFSTEPLTPEELAKMRHRNMILDDEFRSPNSFARAMSLLWVSNLSRAMPGFLKISAAYAAAAGAVSWMAGLFGGFGGGQ